jgi:WD40 repeat protein
VVGTAAGELRVIDLRSRGEFRLRLGRREPPVQAVTFAPDGRRLLARRGMTVTMYDAAGWGVLGELTGPHVSTDAAFSPDGRVIAVASLDGAVTLRDAVTLRETARFDWGVGPVHGVAFAPDGLTCAAGADRGRVVVWDLG